MTNGVIEILISDTTIQSLVGMDKESDTYKVYPVLCPQPEQHPYIVIRINSQEPVDCKENAANDFVYNFSAYVYAVSYKKMVDISNAVKSALDNYQGTSDSVQFEEIRFVTLRDEGVDVAGNVLFARVLTFFAHVYENQAT